MPHDRLTVAAFVPALAVLAGCAARPAPEPAESAYADPALCASCHAEIARFYRETGMGRSFYRSSESVVPSGSFYHKPSQRAYEFSVRGGRFLLRRSQKGFGGGETNRVEKSIDFVIGSGNHARTYLHRNSDGTLYEMPVSWYAGDGGHLAMSPGYDHARHEDFRRPVPEDCLFCHNGYPRGEKLAEGIDCQRCHGPGARHARAAGSGKAKPEEIRAAIVNPARLSRDRQLDTCMQCHLETTSLRLPNAIRNYRRAPFSYVPGEPLTDYEHFFDHAPGSGFDDRFEVAHQGYRLRKSACFLKSGMTCTTCHDPHRALRGEAAVKHYVAVCGSCHAGAHAAGVPRGGSSCLDCHMWKRRTEDAVHVVMTDHFIQRRKPSRDLLAPVAEKLPPYQGEVIAYYPQQADELYLAVAQVQHESNLEAGIPRLERAIAKRKPAEPEFYVELGKAQIEAGKTGDAIRSFEEALRQREGFHEALRELAAALAANGDWKRAIEAGERACAQQPPDTVALTNLGNTYLRSGNPARAKEVLERALAVNPDLPEAKNLLGLVAVAQQNPTAAVAAFREAIAIQPDLAEPHNNLANVLAGAGDTAEAAYHFRKAIAADPGYVEAHRGYGFLLVLMGSMDQALKELQEAVKLAPDNAQIHIDYADILLEKRQAARAAAEYREAIRIDPQLAEAYYGLGNSLMAGYNAAAAVEAYRSAIERNPAYYEAHFALGNALSATGHPAEARLHWQKAASSDDPVIRDAARQALR